MSRLVCVRHGLTDWNQRRLFQGRRDIPLNETGHQQAAAMSVAIAAMQPIALYASPLTRTRETAVHIAERTGLEIRTDERLKEIHVGSWEGLGVDEADDLDPGFRQALRAGEDRRRSPEGETAVECGRRSVGALRDIADAHADDEGVVVIVGHGMALRFGIAELLGWDWEHARQLGGFDNCSWSVLDRAPGVAPHRNGWLLTSHNVNVAQRG